MVCGLRDSFLGGVMSIDETRRVLEAYCEEHDPRYVAEDAVFTMQPTGEEIRGRDAIAKHLAGFYHGALRRPPEPNVFAPCSSESKEIRIWRLRYPAVGIDRYPLDIRIN
jgi:hypothetical protein